MITQICGFLLTLAIFGQYVFYGILGASLGRKDTSQTVNIWRGWPSKTFATAICHTKEGLFNDASGNTKEIKIISNIFFPEV